MNEKEILRKIKSGDENLFNHFVESYQPKIFQHCLSVVKDREIAEDLTQETFLKAYEKLETFQENSSLYTWLFRIAHNLSLNQLKKMKSMKEETYSEALLTPISSAPEENLAFQNALKEGLSQLNENHRRVFELYEIEKKSQKEIAAILHIPHGTVRSRLHYARKKMRTILKRDSFQNG